MYIPASKILERYASVLIDYALANGKGVKPREVVYLQYDSPALPLALTVYQHILNKGANVILKQYNESFEKVFFQTANNDQLDFFPKKFQKSLINLIDHRIYLIAPKDPFYLKEINPKKIVRANQHKTQIRKWLFDKEDKGKLTWTLCLYGTEEMAKEAGLSLGQFWNQIINACYLDQKNPIIQWQRVYKKIHEIRDKLNLLPIDKIHIKAKKTDLWLKLGEKRKWVGGSGQNIPSFEIFTSPDWRGTNGYIFFDLPLYRYGNLIKDIYLEFKQGRVVKAKANKNEQLLKQIIKQKNADKVGEFSLTDKRLSRIDQFMANTLYDENYGGKFGNTHLALGTSYHETFTGKVKEQKTSDWNKLGFNESAEHMDIIAKQDRVVEVVLHDKSKKLIYRKGQFMI